MEGQIHTWQFTTVEMLAQYSYVALIMLLFLIGVELIQRYHDADEKSRKDPVHILFLMIAIAILGYALYNIPTIIIYFYGFERGWQLILQQISIAIILLPIGVFSDKLNGQSKRNKVMLTRLSWINIIYLVFLLILSIAVGFFYPWAFLPVFIIYAIIAVAGLSTIMKVLVVNLRPQDRIRRKIVIMLWIGIALFIISMLSGLFRKDPGTNIDARYAWLRIIYLLFWVTMRFILASFPSYSEFDWKSGILNLYIIHSESGLLIYSHEFTPLSSNTGTQNSIPMDLVGGGIVGIKAMLGEIANEKGRLKHIEIGRKNLIFSSGQGISCLILCEKNLSVYYSILQDLVEKVEQEYPQLVNFNGILDGINLVGIIEGILSVSIKNRSL